MQFLWTYVTTAFLLLTGLFLILIVLLQRGRGGGLAGAFGGMGGQSAFGTKAGDVFTWITIGAAITWVIFAVFAGFAMRSDAQGLYGGGTDVSAPDEGVQAAPGEGAAGEGPPQQTTQPGSPQRPSMGPSPQPGETERPTPGGESGDAGGAANGPQTPAEAAEPPAEEPDPDRAQR